MEPQRAEPAGLMAGLADIARNVFGLLVSRIELAALELGEARHAAARLLLVGALGILALWFAVACWTALVVVLTWDSLGWKILLLLAVLFTLLAGLVLRQARKLLDSGRLALPATLAELRNDRDALL